VAVIIVARSMEVDGRWMVKWGVEGDTERGRESHPSSWSWSLKISSKSKYTLLKILVSRYWICTRKWTYFI
jgi:hypothetical protein